MFLVGYMLMRSQVIKSYYLIRNSAGSSLNQMKTEQDQQLQRIIEYSYKNIPYYRKVFDRLGLKPDEISKVEDLIKLPVLTKSIIRENIEDFYPKNIKMHKYVNGATGGSTGAPLKYRMSDECYSMGVACLYRGWGYAGYRLGDKVAVIAGGSLVNKDTSFFYKLKDFMLNFRHYSSYGMDDSLINKYIDDIAGWKPDYLRGYATSIYEIAKYLNKNKNINKIKVKAVFTTAEMLLPKQRGLIEKVFGCEVFNTYGLNDGGVSAYECSYHDGMHIDMERSVLEVVNEKCSQVVNEEGLILATSLHNTSFPFIRYDTNDIGVVSDSKCKCGCQKTLLKSLKGRVTDSLRLNGSLISSPVLTVLMGSLDILNYQIIQFDERTLEVRLEKGAGFTSEDEDFIKASFESHVGKLHIVFNYTSCFDSVGDVKHKFIINKMDL
ncbi:MAG: phenylacetate--CoA ligase family protein [Gammaproteobacteria bacterium]|nr:phenylacetate--CoA ligase family protein [Gammaproteobacteria bacterium]